MQYQCSKQFKKKLKPDALRDILEYAEHHNDGETNLYKLVLIRRIRDKQIM